MLRQGKKKKKVQLPRQLALHCCFLFFIPGILSYSWLIQAGGAEKILPFQRKKIWPGKCILKLLSQVIGQEYIENSFLKCSKNSFELKERGFVRFPKHLYSARAYGQNARTLRAPMDTDRNYHGQGHQTVIETGIGFQDLVYTAAGHS